MNSKVWIRKTLSMCLAVAITATYSMVALAGSGKIVGELTISGKSIQGENPTVTVNGENAQSGRSIFSSSTVVTSPNASAIINVAKVGKVELAPDTKVIVSFDEKGLTGNLLTGKVTVLGANENISVTTPDGKVANLNAGESAVAGKAQDDDDDNDGGGAWIWYALVFGGAAAALIIAARGDNNRVALGGNTTVASPIR